LQDSINLRGTSENQLSDARIFLRDGFRHRVSALVDLKMISKEERKTKTIL